MSVWPSICREKTTIALNYDFQPKHKLLNENQKGDLEFSDLNFPLTKIIFIIFVSNLWREKEREREREREKEKDSE